jgi:hypothetical protein
MTYLRTYVTGSNDAILNEVGRTTAVSLVGAHQRRGGVIGTQLWDTSWSLRATSVLGFGLI